MMSDIRLDQATGLPYLPDDGTGQRRLLGMLPQAGPMALPHFKEYHAPIPKSEWRDIDLFSVFNPPILDQGQHGCHSDDTEVLTDSGWQAWSSLKSGSLLGTMNPLTHALEFQAPTALHAYEYDGPLHYHSNKRLDFAVTPNHRMYLRKWDERARTLRPDFGIVDAKDIGWYAGLPASTSGFRGVQMERLSIEPDGREMLGDDFVALLAVLLSDGWAGGTENTKNRVSFCCFREDRYPNVAAMAHRLGYQEQPNRKGVWYKSDPAFAEWIRQNLYSDPALGARNKKVPGIIKVLGTRQIQHFLEFFGDKCESSGNRTFYSSSPRLIDDLQELLLRVGKRGTIHDREPRSTRMKDGREIHAENCGSEYILTESTTDRLSIERKKHMEIERYKGTVFCATVPNSLLVTRRNKSVLISGNSCVGHGGCTAFTLAWLAQGEDPLKFAACYLYANINGDRDQGADIGQTIQSLQTRGICLESTVPEGVIFRSRFPDAAKADAEASKYKLIEAYQATDPADVATALQMGYSIADSVMVGNSFLDIDKNGMVGVDRGPGNHCVAKGGMKLINGVWCYINQNSWGASFADGGRFLTTDAHIQAQNYYTAVIYRAVSTGPNAPSYVI